MPEEVVDLRRVDVRALRSLMDEEAAMWLQVLGWDYHATQNYLCSYIRQKMLPGVAILDQGKAVGYLYMVLEADRAILGNLYVLRERWDQDYEKKLAASAAEALQSVPGVKRIEAQLMVFSGADLTETMRQAGFEVFRRFFLTLDLGDWNRSKEKPPDLELRPWHGSMIEEAARVIYEGYVGGVDAYFSTSFSRPDKCLDFVFNLVQRRGCGRFLPKMSPVGFGPGVDMRGVIIATELSPGSGHLPQISVAPAYQGKGFGDYLVGESLHRFKRHNYRTVSLTVTEKNTKAEQWYRRIGFKETLAFNAYLWRRNADQ